MRGSDALRSIGGHLGVPQERYTGPEEAAMPVSEATYERVALEDPEGKWELYCGELRQKPPMTLPHYDVRDALVAVLRSQLQERGFRVRPEGRVSYAGGRYFVADVIVIPASAASRFVEASDQLEVYQEPLPLVAEVWSRSTGRYDIAEKLPVYRERGDVEIWRLHPYERTLTAWRRQPDGSYTEHAFASGTVELHAIPGTTVDLDALFATIDG
jgi:Uma2 family endonuclease